MNKQDSSIDNSIDKVAWEMATSIAQDKKINYEEDGEYFVNVTMLSQYLATSLNQLILQASIDELENVYTDTKSFDDTSAINFAIKRIVDLKAQLTKEKGK